MVNGKCRLLVGVDQIIEYVGVTRPTFYEFVKIGMPAVSINGRWYAYCDNIDDYFRLLTRKTMKEIPEDSE